MDLSFATTEAKRRPNPRVRVIRSASKKYTPQHTLWGIFFIIVCERIRTPGLLVRSQTLYPAELHTHLFMFKYTLLYIHNIQNFITVHIQCQDIILLCLLLRSFPYLSLEIRHLKYPEAFLLLSVFLLVP